MVGATTADWVGPRLLSFRKILRAAALAVACTAALGAPSRGWSEHGPAEAPASAADPLQGVDADLRPGIQWPVTNSAVGVPGREQDPLYVAAFHLEGNRSFSDGTLARVLAPFTGRRLAPEDLKGAVAAVLEHYRSHGFFATSAYLPAQQVQDGVVRLVVADGALGEVGLALSRPALRSPAPPSAASPEPASRQPARRAPSLQFFDALPSSRARASLIGNEQRAADRIVVEIDEGPARTFGADTGIFAAPRSDDWQTGATLRLVNPGGHGGVLTGHGLAAGDGTSHVFGRFDAPLDVDASKLAPAGGYLDQSLAEELFAVEADGDTKVLELVAEKPLIRLPTFSFSVRAKAKHFDRHDEARGTTTAKRQVDTAHLSTRARLRDEMLGGGTTAANVSWVVGHTNLDGFGPYAEADAQGDRTAGSFGRVRASLARQQSLFGPWSFYGAVTAQGSSKNLDGSQRFAIGGLAPARGFPVGEALGDEGFRVNADLRYAVPEEVLGGKLNVALFYDKGELRLRKHGTRAQNSVSHHSVGLSLRQNWTQTAFVHFSAGRQFGSTLVESQDGGSDGNYRFWLRLGLDF